MNRRDKEHAATELPDHVTAHEWNRWGFKSGPEAVIGDEDLSYGGGENVPDIAKAAKDTLARIGLVVDRKSVV